MKRNLLFSLAAGSILLASATGIPGSTIPMPQNPYNVANRVDLTKFSEQQIKSDAMRSTFNAFKKKQGPKQIYREAAETKTYFAIQQSMYSGYSFAYLSGDVLTWNVDITIDGTTATISNLFNLDDPTNEYDTTTEDDIIGTYDATAGTITIATPSEFENATIVGKFYGTYPAVMFAGEVDSSGTLSRVDTELVLKVNEDLSMITTDQHFGCSMYAADGSMSWGVQECFAKSILAIPTEEANIISFAEAVDFGEAYPNYPLTSTFKLANAGNTAGDFVVAIEGEGFSITPETGSIPALGIQDFTVTYIAPEADQEYEGIITITTDQGDILVQLMGTSIPYPDYSAIVKEGEMELTTGMEWPFALDTELVEGKTVGKSTIPGGTGGNQVSYLTATFEVPEGKIGTFSWDGYVNSKTWYQAWACIYFDDSTQYAYQYSGSNGIDIANQQKFGPGKHSVKFQWEASMYGDNPDDILVVYDLAFTLEDAQDYKVTIANDLVEFGNFIIDKDPIASTQTIQLYNEGKQPLKVISATSTDNFSITIPETEVALLEYLPVTVNFAAEESGTFEGDVTITTTAGDITIKNHAFVRDMPDFSKIVTEGEFMFETNADNPYLVHEDGYAYNSTSKVLDTAPTTSRLKCSFTIPEGKLGILSWDAEFSGKSAYDAEYNYIGGETGTLEIQQNMNGYTWMVYGSNGELHEESMGSEAMIAKTDQWTDYSKYTKFTPGTWYVQFTYNQTGDNEYFGEDWLKVSNLKLVLQDFTENQAEVDVTELDFGSLYEGQKAKGNIKFTNTGSANLEFLGVECDGPITVTNLPTWGIAFLNNTVLNVEFNPTTAGTYNNDLIIKTNAGDFTIKCTGEALSKEGMLLFEDMENNAANWLVVDNDGDGLTWDLAWNLGVSSYVHSGEEAICSMSYNYSLGALTPDNWTISPEFTIPAEHDAEVMLTWWIAAQLGDDYIGDKYTVYIIDKELPDALNPNDWTELFSEIVENVEWEERKVDISEYAGKTCRVAFRHHDCEDNWMIKLDDVIVFDGVTGINLTEAKKEVVRQEYFTVDGLRSERPENGIYIVKTIYKDGSSTTRKAIFNNK
ncbi:MAG: choice-of-anchor D domain-containing protein [Bacteroidales bacterium]|nr:choice-of-anchor D domain-containing protein [Bacteroidales bacterium]